jgi:hypothetical protein
MSIPHTSKKLPRARKPAASAPITPTAARTTSGRRKHRLTFTLSGDAVEHIRKLRAKASSPSLSATVERLIESNRRAQRHADLQAGITAYYDALSPAEIEEDADWGAVSEAALAAENPAQRKRRAKSNRRAS